MITSWCRCRCARCARAAWCEVVSARACARSTAAAAQSAARAACTSRTSAAPRSPPAAFSHNDSSDTLHDAPAVTCPCLLLLLHFFIFFIA